MNKVEVVQILDKCDRCLGTALVQKVIVEQDFKGKVIECTYGPTICLDCVAEVPRRAAVDCKIN